MKLTFVFKLIRERIQTQVFHLLLVLSVTGLKQNTSNSRDGDFEMGNLVYA